MCIVHSTMQGENYLHIFVVSHYVIIDIIIGYVAFRCRETGSWFANALGNALVEHACDKSLHEILQQVFLINKAFR